MPESPQSPDTATGDDRIEGSGFARRRTAIVLGAVCVLLLGVFIAMIALISGSSENPEDSTRVSATPLPTGPPPTATALPVPDSATQAQSATALCDLPAAQEALANGDDAAVIALAGGGEGFRQAVVNGAAPCISLRDPARVWFVVNKSMPMEPIDYAPYDWTEPQGVPLGNLAAVRSDIAPTVQAMSDAAVAAGAGRIGMQNAYRGYEVQQRIHSQNVSQLGVAEGEKLAARPGYSEHQSGIAMDVMSCTPGCSSPESFGGTSASDWVIAHGWEYGWIVRYEEGKTDVTGYSPEPWHLRYIGPELAAAYHAGGYQSLEEFFGLPAAPAYPD